MIILNVGHQLFKVKNIADAKALLELFNDMTAVRSDYSDHKTTYSIDGEVDISIKIVSSELIGG